MCVMWMNVEVYLWKSEDSFVEIVLSSTSTLFLGIELRSSVLHSKYFTHWAILMTLTSVPSPGPKMCGNLIF